MKTISYELPDDVAFDHLVVLDCIAEILQEAIDDTSTVDDQRIMRRWLHVLNGIRSVYEHEVIWTPDKEMAI